MCLDSTNKVEQWYVRQNLFNVLNHRLHVSAYIQVIFRPYYTGVSIKCYACWYPIMLTDIKYLKVDQTFMLVKRFMFFKYFISVNMMVSQHA